MPSNFWPDADVIEPVSNWSAEAGPTNPMTTRPATLASNLPRTVIVYLLLSFISWISFPAAARRAARGSCLNWYGSHIRNNGIDLLGLEVVLEGRHARGAVFHELAHDVIVAAAGFLVERRAIGLGAE